MGNRKIYFTLIFIFMCLILYFTNYSLNSNISDSIPQYQARYGKNARISNIVARILHTFPQINDTCQEAFEPKKVSILRNNNWQKLDNASRLFLLSAYEDDRLVVSKFIRIIAMSKGQFSQRIFCRVWYQTIKSSVTEVEMQDLWVTSWDLAKPEQYYRPLLLSCPCRNSSTPVAVSLIHKPCQEPSNVFWLKPSKPNRKQNFAVCLKPLNYQQDLTSRLLEWLELQFILGADVISVYKYHLHPRTMKVLESYAQSGRLVVHEHQLPDVDDQNALETLLSTDAWQKRRHEMAIYNDCFYRHVDSHRFVVNLDLDEAIVPMEHDSWKELLDYAITKDPRLLQSASFAAQNVYFFDSFPEDLSVPRHFHMLRHLHRSANFTPPGFAQKSFFAADLVLSVTNHYALKSLCPGTRTIGAIGKNLAHLHHYRDSCPPKMEKECEDNYMKFWVKDTVISRFKENLMRNVNHKIKELNLSVSI